MSRNTFVRIDAKALCHNVQQVKQRSGGRDIIAMVKSNAYGCGLSQVVPILDGYVSALGVACLEEALAIRALGVNRDCVLFQGIFSRAERQWVAKYGFHSVIHQASQLAWILEKPEANRLRVWVKVNTGMNRLGFAPDEVYKVVAALAACPWVAKPIGLMTHLAFADEPGHAANQQQLQVFERLRLPSLPLIKSIANSAAILSIPEAHAEVVRPGVMLYGVSPFKNQQGLQLGLLPVMHFMSTVMTIHLCRAGEAVGYNGIWRAKKDTLIAVVAAGYGDGYPRHIAANTPVWVNGHFAPIVGQVSMDMMTIDISNCPEVKVGDPVELWGLHMPVERVAQAAGTIPYELLCQFSPRISRSTVFQNNDLFMDNF